MAMVCIYRNQDELESQQTTLLGRMVFFFFQIVATVIIFFLKCCFIFISLVQIKELESELVKATSQLSMEKRRTSSLEVSLVLYSNFNSQGK